MENHEKHMEMKEKHMEMREVLAIMVETVVEYGCEFVSRRLDTIERKVATRNEGSQK